MLRKVGTDFAHFCDSAIYTPIVPHLGINTLSDTKFRKLNRFLCFVLFCFSPGSPTPTETEYGLQPLAGHSLSWESEKKSNLGPNNVMSAKIWIPEDPRESKFDTRHDINSNELESLVETTSSFELL